MTTTVPGRAPARSSRFPRALLSREDGIACISRARMSMEPCPACAGEWAAAVRDARYPPHPIHADASRACDWPGRAGNGTLPCNPAARPLHPPGRILRAGCLGVQAFMRIDIGPGFRALALGMVRFHPITDNAPAVSYAHELALACRVAHWPEHLNYFPLLPVILRRTVMDNGTDDFLPYRFPFS